MRTRLAKCWTLQWRVHLEHALVAACLMTLTLALAPPAFAQSVRVAVIHGGAQDEAARRLRAEVSAAGLDALDVPVSPSEARSTAEITFELRAVSALRIDRNGDVEVIVIDSQTGRVLDRARLPAQDSVAELELTAVEDLRAKLVKLSITLPPSPAEAPTSTEAPAPTHSQPLPASTNPKSAAVPSVPAQPSQRRSERTRLRDAHGVWLQAAAGGALSSGGLSANAVARVGLRVEPWDRWSLSALTLLPISSRKIAAASGQATVKAFVFGAELGFSPVRFRTVEFELGLGAGAAFAEMRGFPSSALDEGRSQSVWSGVALADTAFAWHLARWLRIRMAVLAGTAAPRSVVRFEGESVGTWGRPFATGTLGLEFEPFKAAQGTAGL